MLTDDQMQRLREVAAKVRHSGGLGIRDVHLILAMLDDILADLEAYRQPRQRSLFAGPSAEAR